MFGPGSKNEFMSLLRQFYPVFLQNLQPRKIAPHLFASGIIDLCDMEEIHAARTTEEAAGKLLSLIFRSDAEQAMPAFLKALQEKQPYLAQMLTDRPPRQKHGENGERNKLFGAA